MLPGKYHESPTEWGFLCKFDENSMLHFEVFSKNPQNLLLKAWALGDPSEQVTP